MQLKAGDAKQSDIGALRTVLARPVMDYGRLAAGLLLGMLLLGCGATSPNDDDFVDVPGLGSTRIDVPRPTDRAPDACDVALRSGESVLERGVALREVGLFSGQAAMSDAELGEYLESELSEEWGEIADDDPLIELFIAALDRDRAWWRDLEADVVDGNDVYVAVLQEWAAISRGSFTPESIEETWESEEGPVSVRFVLEGETVELNPAYLEDWIDPTVIVPINGLIAESGRQFELFQAFDQTAFVMALEDGERQALLGRGWCFD